MKKEMIVNEGNMKIHIKDYNVIANNESVTIYVDSNRGNDKLNHATESHTADVEDCAEKVVAVMRDNKEVIIGGKTYSNIGNTIIVNGKIITIDGIPIDQYDEMSRKPTGLDQCEMSKDGDESNR